MIGSKGVGKTTILKALMLRLNDESKKDKSKKDESKKDESKKLSTKQLYFVSSIFLLPTFAAHRIRQTKSNFSCIVRYRL